MAQQEYPGSSTEGPKPRPPFFHVKKTQLFLIIIPLVVINAGIARILTNQLSLRADAQYEVKDDSATTPVAVEADEVPQSAEKSIGSTEPTITTYTVQSGDTLSGIAAKFNISVNTIRWANDLTEKTSKIGIGDELVILPVSGVEYTVKKGDTLSGIAVKFDVSQDEILKYNDIEKDAITVGTSLIIPNAEPLAAPKKKEAPKPTATPAAPAPKTQTTPKTSDTDETKNDASTSVPTSSYASPISGGILTQGIHDGNAVDFGASVGTPVHAFKSGTVIIAKSSGYNGGYGSYVVINHEGSCQTQYSHLSSLSVSVGDKVSQGDTIARSGNTGKSTGPHLHFNVRNCGGNPFAKYKIGTHF